MSQALCVWSATSRPKPPSEVFLGFSHNLDGSLGEESFKSFFFSEVVDYLHSKDPKLGLEGLARFFRRITRGGRCCGNVHEQYFLKLLAPACALAGWSVEEICGMIVLISLCRTRSTRDTLRQVCTLIHHSSIKLKLFKFPSINCSEQLLLINFLKSLL